MRIRSFYKIYRKKPTTEKVDLLVEQVELMMRNEARHSEAIDRGNRDDADYTTIMSSGASENVPGGSDGLSRQR